MSFESTANTIRSRFNTQFSSSRPNVEIAWENVHFEPNNGKPWVRFTITEGESFQSAITPEFRHPGVIIVQVFTPDGQGDGEARAIADDVVSAFQGVTDAGIIYRAGSVNVIGADGNGWYQINVSIPFQYDT